MQPIGGTGRKGESPSSRVTIEDGETSSPLILPLQEQLLCKLNSVSRRCFLSSFEAVLWENAKGLTSMFSASPSSSMLVALSKKEIKLGWHAWFLTNPYSLILFIILHLTSCSFNTFFQPLAENWDWVDYSIFFFKVSSLKRGASLISRDLYAFINFEDNHQGFNVPGCISSNPLILNTFDISRRL